MVQQGHYSELTNILGAIPHHQQLAAPEGPATEEEPVLEQEEGGGGDGVEAAGGAGQPQQVEQQQQQPVLRPGGRRLGRRLQTFVFSATLTLPAALRKRLRKGGGGASGSSDLDNLMDGVPFRCGVLVCRSWVCWCLVQLRLERCACCAAHAGGCPAAGLAAAGKAAALSACCLTACGCRGKPKIVDLTSQRKLADRVEEAYIECGESERDEALYCLLVKHPGGWVRPPCCAPAAAAAAAGPA